MPTEDTKTHENPPSTPTDAENTLTRAEAEGMLAAERARWEATLKEQRTLREQAESALRAQTERTRAGEMRLRAANELARRGLPHTLISVLRCDSEEALDDSLTNVEQAFRASLEQGVRERLRGAPPAAPAAETGTKRLSYQQAVRRYQQQKNNQP
jgi:hypothetical protein